MNLLTHEQQAWGVGGSLAQSEQALSDLELLLNVFRLLVSILVVILT